MLCPYQYGLDRRAQGRFEFPGEGPFGQANRKPGTVSGGSKLDDSRMCPLDDLNNRP